MSRCGGVSGTVRAARSSIDATRKPSSAAAFRAGSASRSVRRCHCTVQKLGWVSVGAFAVINLSSYCTLRGFPTGAKPAPAHAVIGVAAFDGRTLRWAGSSLLIRDDLELVDQPAV